MEHLFKSHKQLQDEDFRLLWEKGLFIFDTSVLTHLYRLPESAKNDLLGILSNDKINKRVWLPFQVALEFTHNRLDVISEQKNKFSEVRKLIDNGISEIQKLQNSIFTDISKLQLKKRHSSIDPDKFINPNLFKEPLSLLKAFTDELNLNEKKQPDVLDKDEIKEKIAEIFKGKIGICFPKEQINNIEKDGYQRYKDQTPPGYKDDSKTGFYFYQDIKLSRKFGDFFIWKEIIEKAKSDKAEFITLVTGDGKEDWWHEKRGKTIGPRYELLNEIYFEANGLKTFHMYEVPRFMEFAHKYLGIKVDNQSIQESKDLIEFNKADEQLNNLIFSNKYKVIGWDFLDIPINHPFENESSFCLEARLSHENQTFSAYYRVITASGQEVWMCFNNIHKPGEEYRHHQVEHGRAYKDTDKLFYFIIENIKQRIKESGIYLSGEPVSIERVRLRADPNSKEPVYFSFDIL